MDLWYTNFHSSSMEAVQWSIYNNKKECYKLKHLRNILVESLVRQVTRWGSRFCRPWMLSDSTLSPSLGGSQGFVKLMHPRRFLCLSGSQAQVVVSRYQVQRWAWPRGIAIRLRMCNIPNSAQPVEISSLSYCRHSFFLGILLDIAKVELQFFLVTCTRTPCLWGSPEWSPSKNRYNLVPMHGQQCLTYVPQESQLAC